MWINVKLLMNIYSQALKLKTYYNCVIIFRRYHFLFIILYSSLKTFNASQSWRTHKNFKYLNITKLKWMYCFYLLFYFSITFLQFKIKKIFFIILFYLFSKFIILNFSCDLNSENILSSKRQYITLIFNNQTYPSLRLPTWNLRGEGWLRV